MQSMIVLMITGCAAHKVSLEPLPYIRDGLAVGGTPIDRLAPKLKLPDDPSVINNVLIQALQKQGYGIVRESPRAVETDIVKLSPHLLTSYNLSNPNLALPEDGRDLATTIRAELRMREGEDWPELRFTYRVKVYHRGFFQWWWGYRGDYEGQYFVDLVDRVVQQHLLETYAVGGM